LWYYFSFFKPQGQILMPAQNDLPPVLSGSFLGIRLKAYFIDFPDIKVSEFRVSGIKNNM
jgi:hypothetical protein